MLSVFLVPLFHKCSFFTVVESYDASGKHTYLAMAITAGCALILLLSLVILYKKLGPISLEKDEREVVEATSKLSVLCEGDHSSGI